MYERFTDRARKVMQLANQEAQRFNQEFIATEHILLGLVKEGSGVAANVLKNLGVDLPKLRREIEQHIHIEPGEGIATHGRLPQTPRVRNVLDFAIAEGRALGHNYVGTEHLLLGLIREQDGAGAKVLTGLGLTPERVRKEVMQLLGPGPPDQSAAGILWDSAKKRISPAPEIDQGPTEPMTEAPPTEPPAGAKSGRESKRAILDRHIEWLRQLMEAAVVRCDLELARDVQKQIAEVRGVRNRMGK